MILFWLIVSNHCIRSDIFLLLFIMFCLSLFPFFFLSDMRMFAFFLLPRQLTPISDRLLLLSRFSCCGNRNSSNLCATFILNEKRHNFFMIINFHFITRQFSGLFPAIFINGWLEKQTRRKTKNGFAACGDFIFSEWQWKYFLRWLVFHCEKSVQNFLLFFPSFFPFLSGKTFSSNGRDFVVIIYVDIFRFQLWTIFPLLSWSLLLLVFCWSRVSPLF